MSSSISSWRRATSLKWFAFMVSIWSAMACSCCFTFILASFTVIKIIKFIKNKTPTFEHFIFVQVESRGREWNTARATAPNRVQCGNEWSRGRPTLIHSAVRCRCAWSTVVQRSPNPVWACFSGTHCRCTRFMYVSRFYI